MLIPVAVDGISVQGVGWTNQATTPYSIGLESSGGPNAIMLNKAYANNYYAGTVDLTSVGTGTLAATSGYVYAMRFFVPANFTAAHVDTFATTAGTVTVADVGIYTMAGVLLSKGLTADLTTGGGGAWTAGVNTWALETVVGLTGGTFYYVTLETTSSSAPSVAAMPANPLVNLNLASSVIDFSIYTTSGTVPTSMTPATLVTNASVLAKPWLGIY